MKIIDGFHFPRSFFKIYFNFAVIVMLRNHPFCYVACVMQHNRNELPDRYCLEIVTNEITQTPLYIDLASLRVTI